jgi:hypothetical protein
MVLIAWLSLWMAGVSWLAKQVGNAREAARRAQCTGNLKQIGLALYNYESACGTLPPAYVADPTGRPLYGWRVLILPHLEQKSLYNRFRLDEPWDSPANLKLLNQMPPTFACPTHQPGVSWSNPGRFTSYLALTGPATAFPGAGSVRLDQILDGPANTLSLVESNQAEVPWTAPVDLDPRTGLLTHTSTPSPPGPTSPHPRHLNVSTVDDSIRATNPEKLRRVLEPLSTIAGGEAVKVDDL